MSLNIAMTVDWEPNHGSWKSQPDATEYSGIIEGTKRLSAILDYLKISCTWFVETSWQADRNLPELFPDLLQTLVSRRSDQFGLHIHWRRAVGNKGIIYETEDALWTEQQIRYGVQQLERFGVRPVCFRSGALLHVTSLPNILQKLGFQVDSSTLRGRSNRPQKVGTGGSRRKLRLSLRKLAGRVFDPNRAPYFTDEEDVEKEGGTYILEIPISYNIFDLLNPVNAAFIKLDRVKAWLKKNDFLVLFLHIDEMLDGAAANNVKRWCGQVAVDHLTRHLEVLNNRRDVRFVTLSQARTFFMEHTFG